MHSRKEIRGRSVPPAKGQVNRMIHYAAGSAVVIILGLCLIVLLPMTAGIRSDSTGKAQFGMQTELLKKSGPMLWSITAASSDQLTLLDRSTIRSTNGRYGTALVNPTADYLTGKWVQKESLSQMYALLVCLFY
ncbi:hypothetical protein [Diplocloster modestus]|uniref:Uncharacterized protein n=1 Tax=Diplocloster modestus TaxID=2850322 RepID=A0ABS6KA37_9FIRM|nr:hypothetical protein [Diplocloster modestus]MBU9727388.1 hypothetical protein [Diplocloster modestus]